ncbi:ferrous iron transport protein B [Spirochaeta lutea]|uniref:ferrous iron transport protein B n=1 Tax=Spirochaeta lutea TaxID=1480694 RepID=UPI00068C5E0A|nr:ferrous iron transport protein B [Spirochaeta lutea]
MSPDRSGAAKHPAPTKAPTIALIGNPNCGKTTLFNGLTGSTQRTGNWPGVTVEQVYGILTLPGEARRTKDAATQAPNLDHGPRGSKPSPVQVVDLPGLYSLNANSEDEQVARRFILSGQADLVVNLVDVSNLERNLYLTLQLLEMGTPLMVVLTKTDRITREINTQALSRALGGIPVAAVNARNRQDQADLAGRLGTLVAPPPSHPRPRDTQPLPVVPYPEELEGWIKTQETLLGDLAADLAVSPRWLAIKYLEQDEELTPRIRERLNSSAAALEATLEMDPDILVADAKYRLIRSISQDTLRKPNRSCCASPGTSSLNHRPDQSGGAAPTPPSRRSRGGRPGLSRADRITMHRVWGIPIFLGVMYLAFWLTMTIGGAFIDFFDILFGTIFVDGTAALLNTLAAPAFLRVLLADGLGAGIQTVATFIPVVGMMFLVLSLLEESGYMARAAFVMDRLLRSIGLPGKAFVPLLVGFGCTVPAIMATRTLEHKRDRIITGFMAPLMSCGARLPVYALFAAAFFPDASGLVVFSLYITGAVLAIGTGLLVKRTLFTGPPTPFIMELPPYQAPRIVPLVSSVGRRLGQFSLRAGKVILIAVAVLGILNSIGTDGSIGNQDSEESLLSLMGKTIQPVFQPMGIQEDNWPATVGLFTGIFAKEAVVGTLNSLYSQVDAQIAAPAAAPNPAPETDSPPAPDAAAESPAFSPWPGIREAFLSIPANLTGWIEGLADPLGIGMIQGDSQEVIQEAGGDAATAAALTSRFSPAGAYAYLLFVLIYFPCAAALGAMVREMGAGYGWAAVVYLTVLAYNIATLFYQLAEGGSIIAILLSLLSLAGIYGAFYLVGRRRGALNTPGASSSRDVA